MVLLGRVREMKSGDLRWSAETRRAWAVFQVALGRDKLLSHILNGSGATLVWMVQDGTGYHVDRPKWVWSFERGSDGEAQVKQAQPGSQGPGPVLRVRGPRHPAEDEEGTARAG